MVLPDRLSGLIEKLEKGSPVSQQDLNRVASLQSLDLAKMGEDFARETIQRDEQLTTQLQESS